jgi:hypothetical protein
LKCRAEFATEMYVYRGTNEYNFEKLTNPPAFEPTLGAARGKPINLGEGGYSCKGGQYSYIIWIASRRNSKDSSRGNENCGGGFSSRCLG